MISHMHHVADGCALLSPACFAFELAGAMGGAQVVGHMRLMRKVPAFVCSSSVGWAADPSAYVIVNSAILDEQQIQGRLASVKQ